MLVAPTEAKLETLADRLRTTHRIEATVIAADLTDPDAAVAIHAHVKTRGISVNLLINNAGFALAGAFLDHTLEQERDQIAVNVMALTALTYLLTTDMRGFGRNAGVIDIASNAAFQRPSILVISAARKSYVLLFSEALGRELLKYGTHVLAVCPGPVETAFWKNIGSELSTNKMDSPKHVVEQSLAAFQQRKSMIKPGRLVNRLQAFATRVVPRSMMVRIAEQTSRKTNDGRARSTAA